MSEIWVGSLKVKLVHIEMLSCQAWLLQVLLFLVEHHLLNLPLKSPMMTVRKGFFYVSASNVKSKL